jgi:hypothetical protein
MTQQSTLDEHLQKIIEWHFNPETGTPFWLDWAQKQDWDPRQEIKCFDDIQRFDHFQDDWLRYEDPQPLTIFLKQAARRACPSSALDGAIISVTMSHLAIHWMILNFLEVKAG